MQTDQNKDEKIDELLHHAGLLRDEAHSIHDVKVNQKQDATDIGVLEHETDYNRTTMWASYSTPGYPPNR